MNFLFVSIRKNLQRIVAAPWSLAYRALAVW